MKLSAEEVRKIAALARLDLTAAEADRHAETISSVLDYMRVLDEVDTADIKPTSQVTGLEDVTRKDIPRDCPYKKELLAEMPEVKENELVVPAVFE